MDFSLEDFLTRYEELKEKFGSSKEFETFEDKYSFEIEFLKFKKKNRLWYDSKNQKWNKEFRPIVKTRWIRDKKNWNKELKKYGYFENYTDGWEMGSVSARKCNYCGKILTNKQTRWCNNSSHKKLFIKALKIAKERFGFTLDKGMIFIPTLYNYTIDKSGKWHEVRNEIERIELRKIRISMNGKQYQLTKKSRTI